MLRGINRWVFRHLDLAVALDGAMEDLLASQYASAPGQPPFAVIPNWERKSLFPAAQAQTPTWPGYAPLRTYEEGMAEAAAWWRGTAAQSSR